MALAILGMFVFNIKTIPFQSISEENSWRHPGKNPVGSKNPPSQFTGKDNTVISINAELRPEITGGDISIMLLKQMANTGWAYPLLYGNGAFKGCYVIEKISEGRSELMADGKARSINFSMTLKKVSNFPLPLLDDALDSIKSTVGDIVSQGVDKAVDMAQGLFK